MRAGTGLATAALVVWVSVAVGPWWLGLVLFLGAWVVNHLEHRLLEQRLRGRTRP